MKKVSLGIEKWAPESEAEITVEQIQNSLFALVEIVDEMVDQEDRVILYQNNSFQHLSIVAKGRHDLLNELRNVAGQNSGRELKIAIKKYEQLSRELGELSSKLAEHGRQLSESVT